MKKIWPWLLLLLLLIIFCVWTKKDSIDLNVTSSVSAVAPQTLSTEKKYIHYTITQTSNGYALNGNFTNAAQQNRLSDTVDAASSRLTIQNISTDDTLLGEKALRLTNDILPHFIAHYSNGKIEYKNQILTINGNVEGYEAKRIMQEHLNKSKIMTKDNTNVVLVEPIDFIIVKEDEKFQLSGTFTNKEQIRTVTKLLRPTYSTANLKKNAHRIDKGAIALTQKILPHFIKNYTKGKISYAHETLIVEGFVENQEALNQMNLLLSNASIPIENLTVIDQEALNRAKAEQLAQEQKKLDALTAAKLAQEEAARKAKLEEAQKLNEVTTAEQTIQKAKENISMLLKIENIEFEVAKGVLTPRGKNTVNKLANILQQYPTIHVEIAGHTDSDGSSQFNQKLSQARVDTVKNRLISQGINAERLIAKGYGESKPLVPNTSNANKQKNRRVEINILGE